jgi:hypothetical protein
MRQLLRAGVKRELRAWIGPNLSGTVGEIYQTLGISRPTLYKYVKKDKG